MKERKNERHSIGKNEGPFKKTDKGEQNEENRMKTMKKVKV